MIKVLFVCLGNICRSPMAEGIFNDLIKERNLLEKISCESAGTAAYHIGNFADPRTRKTLKKHNKEVTSKAKQFIKNDFNKFDYIIAMDSSNYQNILSLRESNDSQAKLFLMRKFDSKKDSDNVPDPYYGGDNGFDDVYNILMRSNIEFLDYILENTK